ncbi:MAG: hypothetical protein VCC00_01470 [Deltaproteobacteria bacterium]
MKYAAIITPEDGSESIVFPDCPGCQTCSWKDGPSAEDMAKDALLGWLEVSLRDQDAPALPRHRRPSRGSRVHWVVLPPTYALRVALQRARRDAGLTRAELARRLRSSVRLLAALEDPARSFDFPLFERAATVLGLEVEARSVA